MPNGGFLTFYDLSSFGITWPPTSVNGSFYDSDNDCVTIGATPTSYEIPVEDDDEVYTGPAPEVGVGDPTGQTYGAGTPLGTPGNTLEGNGGYVTLIITGPDGTVVNFNWVMIGGVGYLESEEVPPGFFEQAGEFKLQSGKVPFKQEYAACFVRGTRLMTPSGEVAVEDLAAGDLVETLDDGAQPIKWVGSQIIHAEGRIAPIKIAKGAMGNARDLYVSPLHRMVLSGWKAELLFDSEEVLATAKSLVNDRSITQCAGGKVEYFHVLFDKHQIVLAEGAPSESFYPGGTGLKAMEQEMTDEILALFPYLLDNPAQFGPMSRKTVKDHEGAMVSQVA